MAEPLSDSLSEQERSLILEQRQHVLDKVKNYIDTYLDPRKKNFFDPVVSNYCEFQDISTILQILGFE